MRADVTGQTRLDGPSFSDLTLDLSCRDEMIPLLRGLQHLQADEFRRRLAEDAILGDLLTKADGTSRSCGETGRPGLNAWQVLVLCVVRQGCDVDYDKLQEWTGSHGSLRCALGFGSWATAGIAHQTIKENVYKIAPETFGLVNDLIVDAAHALLQEHGVTDPVAQLRSDTFVMETNTHYPADSKQLVDSLCKMIERAHGLSQTFPQYFSGWRQWQSQIKKTRAAGKKISEVSRLRGRKSNKKLRKAYQGLLTRGLFLLMRVWAGSDALTQARHSGALPTIDPHLDAQIEELLGWGCCAGMVIDQAQHRLDESLADLPHQDKLFSVFEPHAELINRGKSPFPYQMGRRILITEDRAGFIVHHAVLDRGAHDRDALASTLEALGTRFLGRLSQASFDRGFHTPNNQDIIAALIPKPCLPVTGYKKAAVQERETDDCFKAQRQRHSGIESAINALHHNGARRCRDRTQRGYQRYLTMAVLSRNLITLGRRLIQYENDQAPAGYSQRTAA